MAVHTQVQLKKALGLHQKGELEAAKTIYQEILKKNPSNFNALHLLGAIAAQRQDHELAVDLIKKYDPQRPHALDYFLKITGLREKILEKKIIASRKFSKFASKINPK